MIENSTRAKLAGGATVVGCFVRSPDPAIAEIAGLAGFDFVVSDAEHGGVTRREFENVARSLDASATSPFVRVADGSPSTLLAYLDAGAHGVHVPWVETAADAQRAVRGAKYQPVGARGLAGVRASDHGLGEPLADYTRRANRETMLVAQIESPTAVTNAADICAVDGIDVVFVGPTDLSNSMGLTGQTDHPDVVAAIEAVLAAAAGNGTPVGIFAATLASARRWVDAGVSYVATSAEGALGASLRGFVAEIG